MIRRVCFAPPWKLGATLLLHLALTLGAGGATPKKVLLIHSFVNAAPPFTTLSTAFEAELTATVGEPLDLDEVTLDGARYDDRDMQEALVEYMQKRHARWRPDLVVPMGSPAGVFLARYRDRVFPGVPMIYCGMDRRRLPPDELTRNAAFVGMSFDLPGFMEDILQIAPGTTNVAVVIGASPTEQFWKAAVAADFEPYTDRVGFEWLDQLPFDQMLKRVSRLPPRSFIFLILYMRDASGVTHNADVALQRIHEVANAPVNSVFQHQLGLGIVGGRLYQAEQGGIQAAQIAVRVLQGESPTNFPPRVIGRLAPRYSARELKRWGLNEKDLPPGSLLLYREPSFWARYRSGVIAVSTFVGAQAFLICVLLVNRSRRRRAEKNVTENRNRLRAVLDTAVDGIVTVDEQGVIESVNQAMEELFDYAADDMIGWHIRRLIPSPDLDLHRLSKPARPTDPSKDRGANREAKGRRRDGTEFPIDLSIREVELANRRLFTGFIRNITERKQAEREAKAFGGRLIQTQEAERARLARELHDDITQRLARLAIDSGRAELAQNEQERTDALQNVRQGLVRLSDDVHSLSYQLHPTILKDLGLATALKSECDKFRQQEGIRVTVTVADLPTGIPEDVGLCLFRVTQEALRNAARHAHTTVVDVSLRLCEGGLQLAVADHGIGFDPTQQRQPSLGLESMKERVRLLDGELDIESAPGAGTTIIAWVPLTRPAGIDPEPGGKSIGFKTLAL